MLNMFCYVSMVVVAAVIGLMAFIDLMRTGAPMYGIVLFGCGALFVGGWALIAKEFEDA